MIDNDAYRHPDDIYKKITLGYSMMFPNQYKNALAKHSETSNASNQKELAGKVLDEIINVKE